MKKFTSLTLLLCLCSGIASIDVRIPNHLLECYRSNMTDISNNLQIPMTMQILIELIQRIELTKYLDMRLMATTLLYRAKFDGIQRASQWLETENIVPVGPTAIHFNKYRILLTYLLSGNGELFPTESLTETEFCMLHRLISSSVQAWERGDELRTCPEIRLMHNQNPLHKLMQGKEKSACPIEKGVVQTNWGDISAGHLIAAIASALQNQNVKLIEIVEAIKKDKYIDLSTNSHLFASKNLEEQINNMWASTIAGDLGEVTAYQQLFVSKLVIGPAGTWNDTLVPRAYYLPDSIGSNWEMTLAESLAGIDGAIIGSAIKEWTEKMGRLRLSQVLDMYYSRRGMHFDGKYRACQRKENINRVLGNVDLLEQTVGMAKLLQYHYLSNPAAEWVPIPNDQIETYCKIAVDKFLGNLGATVDPYSACEKGYNVPASDIFVVIDGTWTEYEGRRLIAALSQALDVSLYGSRMGFICGNNGAWMTNVTHSVYQIFEDLTNNKSPWPTTLSVSESFASVIHFLNNRSSEECLENFRSTRNAVIVVLAITDTLDSGDLENSQSLVKTIKEINPSTAILYVTSDENAYAYEQLIRNEFMNDALIKTHKSIEAIVERVSERLTNIPSQIIELNCGKSLEYEDYITPALTTTYEIHFKILQQVSGEIKVEFSGHEYGNLSVCANDKEYPGHKLCQWIDDRNVSVEFATKPFCKHNYACNVQFKVSLQNSENKCTDDDCRFPDQARILIRTSWTNSGSNLTSKLTFVVLIFFLVNWQYLNR